MQDKCLVENCGRPIEIMKHKLCRAHYMRFRSKGEPGNTPILKRVLLEPYKVEENEKTISR